MTISQIYLMLKNPFYYGEFEYPKKSGNWYAGSHPKLVSRELFDLAQRQLAAPQKATWGAKAFPFRRFLTCASCGSQIVGEEKFKARVDGGMNRHVYYHCSRQVNYSCPEPYVREEVVVEELLHISDKMEIDLDRCEPGLARAVQKYGLMTQNTEAFRGYAEYVLRRGTDFEKTRLVRNLETKLVIHNRKVYDQGIGTAVAAQKRL